MNRYYIIFVLVLILIAGGISVWLFSPRPAPTPIGQNETVFPEGRTEAAPSIGPKTKEGAKVAFQTAIIPYNTDNIQLYDTVLAGDYALQMWSGDNTGGEGLLKYDAKSRGWIYMTMGGGAWSVNGLVAYGVPQDVAQALWAGAPH